MEVDADASSAAASEMVRLVPSAAAAAAASTSTLQSVVVVRGTSREPHVNPRVQVPSRLCQGDLFLVGIVRETWA
eukprot:3110115-Amphidinium_carterae.1